MTKLSVIIDALTANADIRMISVTEMPVYRLNIGFPLDIRIVVAPTVPVMRMFPLNQMLCGLASDVVPDSVIEFRETSKYLQIGSLYYTEAVGKVTVRTKIAITAPDILIDPDTLPSGIIRDSETQDLMRRISISLYPSEDLAHRRVTFLNEKCIPLRGLPWREPVAPRKGLIERWLERRFAGAMPLSL